MRVIDRNRDDRRPLRPVGLTRRGAWYGWAGAGLLVATFAVLVLTPGQSLAQEVFGSIFRMLGARDDRYGRDDRYPAFFARAEPFAYARPSEVPQAAPPMRLGPAEPAGCSQIDDATANNGDRYADLANAFVYRDKIVSNCTCNGKDALGLTPVDIAKDPTLRPGDVVATTAGLKVFKGSKGDTHKTADFTPIERTGSISADVRRKLATTRVATSP